MDDANRVVITMVADEAGGCCGFEIMYGKKLLTIDRNHSSLGSTPFDALLERAVVFDTSIHCNCKHHRTTEVQPCEKSSV